MKKRGAKKASTLKNNHDSVQTFELLTGDYYAETFERFPVFGASVGLRQYEPQLGSARPRTYADQARLVRIVLEAIESLPAHDFEGDDWLNRMTLRSHLRRELMDLEEMKTWQTNPQFHLETAADGIHSLLIRHADDLRPAAAAIVSRLKAIPKFLSDATECVEKPVPLWVKLTGQSAPGVVSLLRSLPEPISKVSKHSEEELRRLVESAAAAVTQYAKAVARKTPGPALGYSVGTERFERLIRERLGLHLSAWEAECAAYGLMRKLKAELRAEAKRFHPKKSPAEILESAAHEWKLEGRGLLDAYERQMVVMRERFKDLGAMTFPKGDRLRVKPVPDFMRHQFPTAAYSSPGALDPDQTGIFWVNDLSLIRKTTKEKRAEIEQHFGLELTSAHEAYPGHHLQFVLQHRHPNLARKLASHSIYYEGWTLWCEQMCVDLKVSKNPYLRLQQLHDALWRACRIVVDCGLQTGEMNYNQACQFLCDEVGFTKARAQGDVNWYTSSPGIPMSYLLGKMELLRLKRQRVDRGGWTLKQFNDWVLGFGAIPWSWIESSGL